MAGKQPAPGDSGQWEKAVLVAYFRSIDLTQEAAAKGAGVGVRTVIRWEQSEWWLTAVKEAHERWLSKIICGAKAAIVDGLTNVDESAAMGRWVAERMIGELHPPRRRLEHTGKGGGPIETKAGAGVDLTKLNDDELADYKRLTLKALTDDSGD